MMTAEQFTRMLNINYGVEKEWPKELIVDAETYSLCCQAIIKRAKEDRDLYFNWDGFENRINIAIGKNDGIMFKNVELILKT